MKETKHISRSRAQESSAAIEKMYITMRHLFNRGFYKPMGVSGDTLREALLALRPEIYGNIGEEKVELNGLLYVIERLPTGIEECRFINLTSDEGYSKSHFQAIVPPKRRRNCYRIDEEQMNVEITRGRSDIYDILTHLTFIFIESHKIRNRVLLDDAGEVSRDWFKLEQAVSQNKKLTLVEKEKAISHASNILGRTFEEVLDIYDTFGSVTTPDRFLHVIYWLGKLAIEEIVDDNKRTITFSPILRERLGHHIHGEIWATNIKEVLKENQLLDRPIHVISANMHSVMNSIFAMPSLKTKFKDKSDFFIYEELSKSGAYEVRNQVEEVALKYGMISLPDTSGTNIDVQIFDTAKIDWAKTSFPTANTADKKPVLIVMDYAFGEQAYETIDELLKPYKKETLLNVESVSIMGKAGILEGGKGDIMIPNAHINEGTADNYFFHNELSAAMFEGNDIAVFAGPMVTVLGTSLQNRDLLKFFHESTWGVIGLEMEGSYYQKAIQSASKIRKSVPLDIKVRYAYYASDNPLETGSTLASGGLGTTGVKPTYLITIKILEQIFNAK
ncbi:DUF6909 family protein [Flavobacterium gawalongense]|uniref:Uncharacterized protein n=1 Tax=Flavobacterium gawalongense TaxID=2594432 RepID=A0A553BWE2_9FLAO|nr:hypothetical protein [Flavobacterium gawalongense]TRX01721.1 hypothetical protein FNW33_08655 [Flavobacterium gawalongense]TRX08486.1 hypothetical protein FNW12_04380 [Flavobacterium gawalongense]TRX09708.1 hypothetical protein FNW10_10595 [Flavobacterium gawalongense]TRX12601.1 hypothetical protein FNW11_03430 [Flavobacterium gawalongense]TRX26831.1 hypothetical protein FNW38_10260 [Flavobacterium gawalongense]